MTRASVLVAAASLAALAVSALPPSEDSTSEDPMARQPGEWITWGGDEHYTRYSPLDQIDASNVASLEVAWRWMAEELPSGPDRNWKATPIVKNGVMYVPTGGSKVAAIDPGTGETLWMFAPDPLRVGERLFTGSSRAVSYWTDGEVERILHNSIDGRLFSIDAKTGRFDLDFGEAGVVDLKQELLEPGDPREVPDLGSTGPGIVVGDVIVVQVITSDTPRNKTQAPGYVRGYDVRTGERLWVFHTIPWQGDAGNETWEEESWRYTGNASVWTMMSADPELGYVYLPVESGTNNFWGGQRPGDGLYGESIVCLDAATGEKVWHFQILHHGVWDYDLPAAPILHDVEKDGETIQAVTVLTKQAMAFTFDRATGEPVWPIEERPVPTEMGVPGEKLSPTQPFPTKPPPYDNLGYHEEDLIDFTPELKQQALDVIGEFVTGPMYTPPTLVGEGIPTRGTIVYPNYGGGSNWNGGAVDVETNTLFVPTRRTHMAVGLEKANPELTDWDYVTSRRSGRGWLRLPNRLPITKPPWALVTATDMNRGEHLWRRSIGGAPDWIRDHPDLQGLDLDFDNMGQISARPSPLVTKTLMFLAESGNIGGDPGGPMFRAYDKATGEVIAEIELPAKTSGAPMTYEHDGRQYIAVALAENDHPAELVALSLPSGDRPGVQTTQSRGGAADTAPAQADPVAQVAATPDQLEQGRGLYAQHCAFCHGDDGGGGAGASAPSLDVARGLADVRKMITDGGAEMMGFGPVLTEEQIDAVARFVLVELRSSND